MIKYLFRLSIFLSFFTLNSQTFDDISRYLSYNYDGTSRFNSMGGAFGALGGEISSIILNPAGSSVFLESELTFTLNSLDIKTENNFNNSINNSHKKFYNLNQFGIVLVSDIFDSKFSIGYSMNRLNDYNNTYNFKGKNSKGIDNYFLKYANGIHLNDLLVYENETISDAYKYIGDNFGFGSQQAFLGFQSFIINSNEDENIYVSNSKYKSVIQELGINRKGDYFIHSLNFSSSYSENLLFGINLNLHSLNFEEDKKFTESGYSDNSNLNSVIFNERLLSIGQGVSLQFGTLIKIKDLRLGISYTSPSFLEIHEENSQLIETKVKIDNEIKTLLIEPNVINIYEPYKLKIPSKRLLSIAYVFGRRGLISFDYEHTDYNNAKIKDNNGEDSYLNSLNKLIKDKLNSNSNIFRLGTEYRFQKYSLRGGFYIYEGPSIKSKKYFSGVTSGFGVNFGYFNLDIGISFSDKINYNSIYSEGLTDSYSIKSKLVNILTSLTFKL